MLAIRNIRGNRLVTGVIVHLLNPPEFIQFLITALGVAVFQINNRLLVLLVNLAVNAGKFGSGKSANCGEND